ncbi:hypothetical protein POPTR_002G006501v4 [Populus trichocarpa]|uniref:Uncharacterized protein n=1 Tax=Populus trichocarpa TaxID=3694 RepID=A0ACC0TBW1_POPTR|nr:hypothetical protein POPTR_002G006501v4 [Populus trichocarpa]
MLAQCCLLALEWDCIMISMKKLGTFYHGKKGFSCDKSWFVELFYVKGRCDVDKDFKQFGCCLDSLQSFLEIPFLYDNFVTLFICICL